MKRKSQEVTDLPKCGNENQTCDIRTPLSCRTLFIFHVSLLIVHDPNSRILDLGRSPRSLFGTSGIFDTTQNQALWISLLVNNKPCFHMYAATVASKKFLFPSENRTQSKTVSTTISSETCGRLTKGILEEMLP